MLATKFLKNLTDIKARFIIKNKMWKNKIMFL